MATLVVLSIDPGAGKTAISAALGKCLVAAGKKVAYLKLAAPGVTDGDGAFMKLALALPEAADAMTLSVSPDSSPDQARQAVDGLAKGRDAVIVEGTAGDDKVCQGYRQMVKDLDARVLFVESYKSSRPEVYKSFGQNLVGVVVNRVPVSQLKRVREAEAARLASVGITLRGVLPEDRSLLSLTVAEVADGIQGKILNSADKSGRLVENFMLGAMCVDSGLLYYGRKPRKAAVLRADRPDMQLAALETDTACLVLTGSANPPINSVAFKAENRGIPIIASESSTIDIVAAIEEALAKSRVQPEKLSRWAEIMPSNVDIRTLCGEMGVAG